MEGGHGDHRGTGGSAATASARGVEIRPVTLDDLEVLIDIYLDTAIHHAAIDPEVFHVPSRDDVAVRLRRRIEGRGETGEYVAAMFDGVMVGAASVDLDEPPVPGSMMRPVRSAELGVSVVAGQRGRGIGRALIAHLEAWAAEHGVERMVLDVSSANEGAIRLYQDLGYRDYDRSMLKDLGVR
jgi:ribosomal protein S18 acetylase RimI-like enzyme